MSTSTREDFRRRKELEEARKAGTIPAEVDEEGNEINPHIPRYIAQAPWYIDSGQPSLKHQKVDKDSDYRSSSYVGDEEKFSEWYQRGVSKQQSVSATKYRKGACENCGSMTHKVKDCLERPRKLGAKWTGKDIAGDELVQDFELSFDAKRDRWNGYDGEDHMRLIEEWELIEEARKKLKQQEADQHFLSTNVDTSSSLSSTNGGDLLVKATIEEGDEDKYAEASDMPGQKVDLKTRTTVRNLRIREDTAKYLRNLDPSSAYYDPKTRSMRENPNKDKDPSELVYAGDNFIRASGDVSNFARVQLFAWEAAEKGEALHTLATPSQTELMYKQNLETKGKTRELEKRMILEKYGSGEGEGHFETPSQELLLAQSEHYVEYSRSGKLLKGEEKHAHIRSRYEEDVYINNHTSVWGSFWQEGRWGYACCHQFLKSSYCLGKKTLIESVEEEQHRIPETKDTYESVSEKEDLSSSSSIKKTRGMTPLHEQDSKKSHREDKKISSDHNSKRDLITSSHKKLSDSSSNFELDETQWQSLDERRRPYTSSLLDSQLNDELSEDQLETYRLKRLHAADPMKDYISKDR